MRGKGRMTGADMDNITNNLMIRFIQCLAYFPVYRDIRQYWAFSTKKSLEKSPTERVDNIKWKIMIQVDITKDRQP